jgi:spore maturation protein CgeB
LADRLGTQSLAAGGGLVLMQYFHDYETLGLKDGEHFVMWRDFDDLAAKIEYWLKPEQEEERRALAAAGQRLCLEQHSFDIRVRELLGFLAELG